jgi:hypothetical protein
LDKTLFPARPEGFYMKGVNTRIRWLMPPLDGTTLVCSIVCIYCLPHDAEKRVGLSAQGMSHCLLTLVVVSGTRPWTICFISCVWQYYHNFIRGWWNVWVFQALTMGCELCCLMWDGFGISRKWLVCMPDVFYGMPLAVHIAVATRS